MIMRFVGVIFMAYVCLFMHTGARAGGTDMSDHFRIMKTFEEETYFSKDAKIVDRDGKIIDVRSDAQGRYTVLNVWATWCPSCVRELPSLDRLSALPEMQDEWRVYAVSIDLEAHQDKVFSYVSDKGLSDFALHFDQGFSMQKHMDIRGLPVTWILDDQGRIIYEIIGEAEWDSPDVVAFLTSLRP